MKRLMAATAAIALFLVWLKDGGVSVVVIVIAAVVMAVFVGVFWLAAGFVLGGIADVSSDRHQKRETNADGAIIAYRKVVKTDHGDFFSVSYGAKGHNSVTGLPRGWYQDGWNTSDRIPTVKNTSGIYAVKTSDNPELENYPGVLVKVELSGRVIESETGYRAQHCRVVEVLE